LIIIYRICLPETNAFLVREAERKAREKLVDDANTSGIAAATGMKAFGKEARKGFRDNVSLLFPPKLKLRVGFYGWMAD
jgi:hypothetical protein